MTNYNIISKKSAHIAIFHDLYVHNFPDCERREWQREVMLLEQDNRFHVVMACEDDTPVGFISYWTFDTFTYIEHLAVYQPHRGRGHGSGLVRHAAASGRYLLLEVEPPVDDTTRKRIAFYERLGLVLRPEVDYVQPPYATGKPSVPLCLMTTPLMPLDALHDAVATLKHDVYRA